MKKFLKIPFEDQRRVLGNLLFQKMYQVVKDKNSNKNMQVILYSKYLGMLIDPSDLNYVKCRICRDI